MFEVEMLSYESVDTKEASKVSKTLPQLNVTKAVQNKPISIEGKNTLFVLWFREIV